VIRRTLARRLKSLSAKFPVLVVAGPRQSGKTTLVRKTFPSYEYVSLEDLDLREYAEKDPRAFLDEHPGRVILDEVQRVPSILSYLQTRVDKGRENGLYVLTGSQNLLLQGAVSQTLAGRAAYLTLLPFSLDELAGTRHEPGDPDSCLFRGFYPRLFNGRLKPGEWYPNYIRTYLEREVRTVKNVSDLSAFQRFVRLCAGRIGQLVNLSGLAGDSGITHHTAAAWLSILEASYIVFHVRPFHSNFNKRIIKAPKLYFYDTGLACSLLGIESPSQTRTHYLKGALFENLVVSEVVKFRLHRGKEPACWFWRDKMGREVDCLLEAAGRLIALEAKAGTTVAGDYFKSLAYFGEVSRHSAHRAAVVYGGDSDHRRGGADVVSWRHIASYLSEVGAEE
jgi:predicted AAA+ superfamily ATPase